jgi:hypothetical protein
MKWSPGFVFFATVRALSTSRLMLPVVGVADAAGAPASCIAGINAATMLAARSAILERLRADGITRTVPPSIDACPHTRVVGRNSRWCKHF